MYFGYIFKNISAKFLCTLTQLGKNVIKEALFACRFNALSKEYKIYIGIGKRGNKTYSVTVTVRRLKVQHDVGHIILVVYPMVNFH